MARNYLPKTPFPNWADDDDYPAGTDPWSGAPTKIEPTGIVRAAGVQPDDQISAQRWNWLQHQVGALLNALVHGPMQTWQPCTVAADGYPYTTGTRTKVVNESPLLSNLGTWQESGGQVTQIANAADEISWGVDLPLGSVIESVSISLQPAAGHGGIPVTQPFIKLYRLNKDTNAVDFLGASQGTAGSTPNYDAGVTMQPLTFDASVNNVVDGNHAFRIVVIGEHGTNWKTGLAVSPPVVTYHDGRDAGKVICATRNSLIDLGLIDAHGLAAFGADENLVSSNGQSWIAGANLVNVIDANGDIQDTIVAITGDRRIYRSTDNARTWGSAIIAPASGSFRLLHCCNKENIPNRLMAAILGVSDGTANRLYVSDDGGANWVAKSIVSSGYDIIGLADDSAGNVVAICITSGDPVILHSANNGDTWTLVRTLANGAGYVAWSPVWKQFLYVGIGVAGAAELLNSADGATWIQRTPAGTLTSTTGIPSYVDGAIHPLECIGSVFALVCNASHATTTRTENGVLYTFDFGETWTFYPFDYTGEDQLHQLTMIRSLGNRFAIGSAGQLWLSGLIAGAGADLSVS